MSTIHNIHNPINYSIIIKSKTPAEIDKQIQLIDGEIKEIEKKEVNCELKLEYYNLRFQKEAYEAIKSSITNSKLELHKLCIGTNEEIRKNTVVINCHSSIHEPKAIILPKDTNIFIYNKLDSKFFAPQMANFVGNILQHPDYLPSKLKDDVIHHYKGETDVFIDMKLTFDFSSGYECPNLKEKMGIFLLNDIFNNEKDILKKYYDNTTDQNPWLEYTLHGKLTALKEKIISKSSVIQLSEVMKDLYKICKIKNFIILGCRKLKKEAAPLRHRLRSYTNNNNNIEIYRQTSENLKKIKYPGNIWDLVTVSPSSLVVLGGRKKSRNKTRNKKKNKTRNKTRNKSRNKKKNKTINKTRNITDKM